MCDVCSDLDLVYETKAEDKVKGEKYIQKTKQCLFICPECGVEHTVLHIYEQTVKQSQKEALKRYQKTQKYKDYRHKLHESKKEQSTEKTTKVFITDSPDNSPIILRNARTKRIQDNDKQMLGTKQ